MSELLDVLTPDGLRRIGVAPRHVVHREGLWHATMHLWVTGPDGVLLQRRSAAKAAWPGLLDATAAGHLTTGESALDGLREAEEELGVAFTEAGVTPWRTVAIEDEPAGMVNREHAHVFLADDPRPLKAWTDFDRGELDGLVALAPAALLALVDGTPAAARSWDGSSVRDVVVEPGELLRAPYLGELAAHLARTA